MKRQPHYLARAELQRTDWKIFRAMERQFASKEWCDWRDAVRKLASDPEGFDELPPEPPFGQADEREMSRLMAQDPAERTLSPEEIAQRMPREVRISQSDLDAVLAQHDELKAENARLKFERDNPVPPLEAKLLDYGPGPSVPEEIAALLEPGEELTPERVKFLTAALNAEKVNLRDARLLGKAGADELRREGDVDSLLGLFARLGEV